MMLSISSGSPLIGVYAQCAPKRLLLGKKFGQRKLGKSLSETPLTFKFFKFKQEKKIGGRSRNGDSPDKASL